MAGRSARCLATTRCYAEWRPDHHLGRIDRRDQAWHKQGRRAMPLEPSRVAPAWPPTSPSRRSPATPCALLDVLAHVFDAGATLPARPTSSWTKPIPRRRNAGKPARRAKSARRSAGIPYGSAAPVHAHGLTGRQWQTKTRRPRAG